MRSDSKDGSFARVLMVAMASMERLEQTVQMEEMALQVSIFITPPQHLGMLQSHSSQAGGSLKYAWQ